MSLCGPFCKGKHWLKLPTLARHHSNRLHELFCDRRSWEGTQNQQATTNQNLGKVKRRHKASLVAQVVESAHSAGDPTQVSSLGLEDHLEKERATHSSTLAWKIPWMEEPGRLQSMGSQRVRQDWANLLSLSFFQNKTPVHMSYQHPRILLARIHLGWAMRTQPGRTLSQSDWPETTQKIIPSS